MFWILRETWTGKYKMRITIAILFSHNYGADSIGSAEIRSAAENGHVIDPKNNIDEARDVAISKGLIAAVEKNIAPSTAAQVIDLNGLYARRASSTFTSTSTRRTGGRLYGRPERLPRRAQLPRLHDDDGRRGHRAGAISRTSSSA